MRVDLNSDLGESFGPWVMGDDKAMLDLVTSANVACGFHGGDADVMRSTIAAAKQRGVAIGAHPGFQDLQGFGRRRILGLSGREIENLVAYQIGALQALAALEGYRVTHVKAHGALSNMACEAAAIADALARAVKGVDASLFFVVLPLTETERAGEAHGLRLAREIYADRAYLDDGNLAPRSQKGTVLHDAAIIGERVLAMVRDQAIITLSGKRLKMPIDTICIHGDTPGAVAIARSLRAKLEGAGVTLESFASRS